MSKSNNQRLFTDYPVKNFTIHTEYSGQSDHLPLSFTI